MVGPGRNRIDPCPHLWSCGGTAGGCGSPLENDLSLCPWQEGLQVQCSVEAPGVRPGATTGLDWPQTDGIIESSSHCRPDPCPALPSLPPVGAMQDPWGHLAALPTKV